MTGGSSGAGDSKGGSSGKGGSAGTGGDMGGAGGGTDEECVETALVSRRLVRLTDYQVVTSVSALVGASAAATAVADEDIPSRANRSFPPLAEGGTQISDAYFSLRDRIAADIGKNALDNFTSVTGCSSPATDACAREYVADFAEKAFRRPLVDAELQNLLTVYDECKSFGGTVQEATQHVVWAVLDSPLFLYRTEFGEGDETAPEVPLAPYEMASELSYFLTDGPPDAELLDAASLGELFDRRRDWRARRTPACDSGGALQLRSRHDELLPARVDPKHRHRPSERPGVHRRFRHPQFHVP